MRLFLLRQALSVSAAQGLTVGIESVKPVTDVRSRFTAAKSLVSGFGGSSSFVIEFIFPAVLPRVPVTLPLLAATSLSSGLFLPLSVGGGRRMGGA